MLTVHIVKAIVFQESRYGCELDHEERLNTEKIDALEIGTRKTLEKSTDCRENLINQYLKDPES